MFDVMFIYDNEVDDVDYDAYMSNNMISKIL